jgi:hypothetical protein
VTGLPLRLAPARRWGWRRAEPPSARCRTCSSAGSEEMAYVSGASVGMIARTDERTFLRLWRGLATVEGVTVVRCVQEEHGNRGNAGGAPRRRLLAFRRLSLGRR